MSCLCGCTGAGKLDCQGAALKDCYTHKQFAKRAGQQQRQQNTLAVTYWRHKLSGRLTQPDAGHQQAHRQACRGRSAASPAAKSWPESCHHIRFAASSATAACRPTASPAGAGSATPADGSFLSRDSAASHGQHATRDDAVAAAAAPNQWSRLWGSSSAYVNAHDAWACSSSGHPAKRVPGNAF